MLTVVRQLWRGELPLVQAFWIFGVLGTLAISALQSTVLLDEPDPAMSTSLAMLILMSAWQTLILVGVWRSARRHEGPRWQAQGAQLAVIAFGLYSVAMLLMALTMFTLLLAVLLNPPFIK